MEDNTMEPGDKTPSSTATSMRLHLDKDGCGSTERRDNTTLLSDGSKGSQEKINCEIPSGLSSDANKPEGLVNPLIVNRRCDFCDKVFYRFAHKKRHIISTNCAEKYPEKLGVCYYCKLEVKSEELKQHYIDNDCVNINAYNASRKQDVFCDFCGKGFVNLNTTKLHIIRTNCVDKFPNKVGVCYLCKKDFEGKALKQHYIDNDCKIKGRQRKTIAYVCDFCNKRFANFSLKKKHIIATVCTDNYLELSGTCHFCKKQFKGNDLKEHYAKNNCVSVNSYTAWENQEFYCDFCGNGFKEFANKKKHILKTNCTEKFPEKFGVCYYCKKEFKSKDLQQHYFRNTDCGTNRFKGINGENVCDFCGKTFAQFGNKKIHIISTNCTDRFPEKFGVCYFCKIKFKSNDLKEHYKTNVCRKGISRVSAKQKSYFCDFCEMGFTELRSKKSHILKTECTNRFPDKFGVCYLCKKRFKSKDLRMHYISNKCKQTSTSKVRNESSVSKSSREGFEHCQLCNKRFRKRCELKSHLKYSTCPFLNREKQVNCLKCSAVLIGKEYKNHLLGKRCDIKKAKFD